MRYIIRMLVANTVLIAAISPGAPSEVAWTDLSHADIARPEVHTSSGQPFLRPTSRVIAEATHSAIIRLAVQVALRRDRADRSAGRPRSGNRSARQPWSRL